MAFTPTIEQKMFSTYWTGLPEEDKARLIRLGFSTAESPLIGPLKYILELAKRVELLETELDKVRLQALF